jgi:hypothetical protein
MDAEKGITNRFSGQQRWTSVWDPSTQLRKTSKERQFMNRLTDVRARKRLNAQLSKRVSESPRIGFFGGL